MNLYSISGAILMLIFYIGFTIASFYGATVIEDTYQLHDAIHVKELNCTCLPDDTQYQCVHEAVRMGLTMYKTWCNRIETIGTPLQYQFCRCIRTQSRTNGCAKIDCHMIDNPIIDIPETCDEEKCDGDGCDALETWTLAGKIGGVVGILTSIAIIVAICKAVKSSDENIDFESFRYLHVLAVIPPTMVAFSLLTTNVLKHYSDVRVNTWAWTMLIGFGAPIGLVSVRHWIGIGFGVPLLVVWTCEIRKYYRMTKQSSGS